MSDVSFRQPLRLAVGSHKAGSGKGCGMNVVSYENGDSTITDLPSCSDRFLAKLVQYVNDSICTHRNGTDLLCPQCSMKVLDLAHRTVGTGDLDLTPDQRQRIWVAIAADQARSVLHLAKNKSQSEKYIVMAETYANGGPRPACISYVSTAANAAANAAAGAAATAAGAAATAAAYTYAAAAANAATYAAYAATYAAYAAYAAGSRLERTHHCIDMFEELTQHVASVVSPVLVERALEFMLVGAK